MSTRIVIIAIAVLLVLGGAGVIQYQQQQIDRLSLEREDLLQMANDSARVARTYINLFGNEVSKNRVLGMSLRNSQELLASEELAWIRKFEGLKKNVGNLQQATKLDAAVDINITAPVIPSQDPDSTDVRKYEYLDKFNALRIAAGPDSVDVEGQIQVPIEGVLYWQRKHKVLWFRMGPKEYFSEFSSDNPWVHITNHEVIQVRKR